MSLQKILRSKRSQAALEYICTAMVIFAALLAIKFITTDPKNPFAGNPVIDSIRNTTDNAMRNFGVQVQ